MIELDKYKMLFCWTDDAEIEVTDNFKAGEFCSRKKYPWFISKLLIEKLQIMRNLIKIPIGINSGWRGPVHNSSIGGAAKSRHMIGLAADIKVKGKTPLEVAGLAYAIGIRRIGIARTYVHVDIAPGEAYWLYKGVRLPMLQRRKDLGMEDEIVSNIKLEAAKWEVALDTLSL